MSFVQQRNRFVNHFGQDGESLIFKEFVVHIPCYDFVILTHALNHQLFNHFTEAKLKFVERISLSQLNDSGSSCSFFLYLLKEKPVFFSKVCAETFVENLDNFRERRLFLFSFS